MSKLSRRDFIRTAGGLTLLSAYGFPLFAAAADSAAPAAAPAAPATPAATKARVIVIGGGYGGTIAAKYLRMADPAIEVTLIEKNAEFISCPLSNEVLSGERDLKSLTFNYKGLEGHGVKVVIAEVTAIDPVKKSVTAAGQELAYDKLVVSPGVDFKWDSIQGYSAELAESKIPHAWKAGAQTTLLRKQIEGMKDGGKVIITAPPDPFRCPPGPYERAAQIASYLKHHKPKSKVIILDDKAGFSKQSLFTQGWQMHYGDMIEWVSGEQGGKVSAVNPDAMTVTGELEDLSADVINIIPPQKAGPIAFAAGLTNETGWCPVDQRTFESTIHKDVYVIGDACIAGKMPKSGYAANSHGKVCAAAIVASVNATPIPEPSYVNTCYSVIAPNHGISVAAVYRLEGKEIVPVPDSGGISPLGASERDRALEAEYAYSWLKNITSDMFG